jgi:WD repeat-containing protein 45
MSDVDIQSRHQHFAHCFIFSNKMSSLKLAQSHLLYIGFNQDYGCFAVGTDQGFRIYNCDPFKETFRRDFASGGIGIVEMLFRCNILALVGGGKNPRYPLNKVMIWDDHQNRCIGELSFRSEIRSVKLRRDRVIVTLSNKIYVYNFADLSLLDHIETIENPKGLCVVSSNTHSNILACPSTQKGHVRIELYDLHKTTLIAAHETSLACIALSYHGTRLATASEKGTLIRVYDTATGELLQELRRGTDRAEIYGLVFNQNASLLACTSDKGTVHIFKLSDAVHESSDASTSGGAFNASSSHSHDANFQPITSTSGTLHVEEQHEDSVNTASHASTGNKSSSLSFMKAVLPKYFSSEWSFAQFRIPQTRPAIACFGPEPNTLIVVTADGAYFKANFGPSGGEASRTAYAQFCALETPAISEAP